MFRWRCCLECGLLNSYNQIISLPLYTMFYDLYEKAKKKIAENFKQGVEYYRMALKHKPKEKNNFSDRLREQEEDKVVWVDYYSVKIEFGGVLRDEGMKRRQKGKINNQLSQCNDLYQQLIKEFKEEQDINLLLSKDEKDQLEYSLYQNFAKLLIGLAEFELEENKYEKYRSKLNASYKYFRKAQNIVIDILDKQLNKDGFVKGLWAQRYLLLVANLTELLFLESQAFVDQKCIDEIIKVEVHIEKFYKINRNKHKHPQMEEHLTRFQYSKAAALKLVLRQKEALHLLLKVYEKEKSGGLKEDAQKSRDLILSNLLCLNEMKQAEKYVLNLQQRQIIRGIHIRRQKFKKVFSEPAEKIKSYTLSIIEDMFEQFDSQTNQYTYDYEIIDKLISPVVRLFRDKTYEKQLLYYFLSEANLKLRKFKRSLQMIDECLRVSRDDKLDRMDWRIQQFKVRIYFNPQDPGIERSYQAMTHELKMFMKQESDQQRIQSQIEQLNEFKMIYQRERKKANDHVDYLIVHENDKNLINKIVKVKNNSEHLKSKVDLGKYEVTSHHEYSQSEVHPDWRRKSEPERSSHHERQGYRPFRAPELNPQQLYIKACKENRVTERPQIAKIISNGNPQNFNPFQQMLNLSISELEVLLSFLKVDNIDLRKHRFNENSFQVIINNPYLGEVRKFKINGTNMVSYEILLKTIDKMPQLQYLSFLDFSALRPRIFNQLQNMELPGSNQFEQGEPRSLVHSLSILARNKFNPIATNIKVLKLKYCNLMDDHLRQMMLEKYCFLEDVSLSHNLLKGKQFSIVLSLHNITKINISDNPLQTLDYERWKMNLFGLKITSLKVRKTRVEGDYLQHLKSLLLKVDSFDCSQCQNIGALFQGLVSNIYDGFSTHFLRLSLRHIDLNEIKIENLIQVSGQLQMLDLRFCSFSSHFKTQIQSQLIQHTAATIKISPALQEPRIINRFALC